MDDVLEREPRHAAPRWVAPLAAVLVVLGGAYAVTHAGDGFSGSPDARPGPTGATSDAEPAQDPVSEGTPWPTVKGACSNEVNLPLLSTAPLTERTGLTVLVGGDGLRLVDVDTGRTRRLPGAAHNDKVQVTSLAATSKDVIALQHRCGGTSMFSSGVAMRVDARRGVRRADLGPRVDALLTGPDGAWGYSYDNDPMTAVVLRPIGGGKPIRLPSGFSPGAATRDSFLGFLNTKDGDAFQNPPLLAAVDRDAGTIRRFARGFLVTATDDYVLTGDGCDVDTRCVLTRTGSNGDTRVYRLPGGRTPSSQAVAAPDGRYVALALSRSRPDPRYLTGHPGGPSEIAVLDLDTGGLEFVPGVELAPKSGVGLTFSADGRWLVLALNEGTRSRLLVWRSGMEQPQESPARLPGKALYEVPVLDVTSTAGRRPPSS